MNVLFVGPRPRAARDDGTGRMELARRIEELSARLDALEKALAARPRTRAAAKKPA